MADLSRRDFLATTAAAGALAATQGLAKAAPSERVNVCVIGIRGRGNGLGKGFAELPNAQVTHICDVNETLLEPFAKEIAGVQKSTPKTLTDLRRALDDKSIDAIAVATPDHWHALATIWGCQAGKHVYVEKPISNNVFEGQQMIAAARKHNRVVQVGTQARSAPHYREVIQMIHAGRIGRVHMVKAFNSQLRRRVPATPDSDVPAGLDWNIWQGPAPERPFNANRYTYGWRWLWDYGTGDMGNDGVHDLDIARWGLGVQTHPSRVAAMGGKYFFDDDQQFPDTQYAICEYPRDGAPDGRTIQLIFEQRTWSPYVQEGYEAGAAFYGTRGMLLVGHVQGWRLYAEQNKLVAEATGEPNLTDHYDNFFACIRGDANQPAADALTGHRAATICHLANISARVGRTLNFNPENETIAGDEPANALLRRRYREGHWAVPKGVA
jgi:predicted dehydrogenase